MSIAIRQIDRISIGPAQARHDLQCWILVCLLSVTPPPVMGGGNPIYLRAQHITVDQRKGISTYRGKVRLTRGELSFTATKATVKQRNNKITIVKAYGNPVIVKKYNSQKNIMTIVSGQQLTYLAKPDRAIITGKVITRQGSDVIRSAKVTYDIKNNTLVAEGLDRSLRVNAVFRIKRSTTQSDRPGKQ